MPKKMKPVTVRAYSRARGADLLCLSMGGVDGAAVHTCHPEWRERCVEEKACLRLFSEGSIPKKKELAKLMKKPESRVTVHDMFQESQKFEKRAFRCCRLVKIVATDAPRGR